MKILRSVCPYDCPDACGLLVHVTDGKAVKVLGDPDHPFTRGTLCRKMAHYEKTVHSPRRLTSPLRRKGSKGSGCFENITWEEAIGVITERWRQIIERRNDGACSAQCRSSFFLLLRSVPTGTDDLRPCQILWLECGDGTNSGA